MAESWPPGVPFAITMDSLSTAMPDGRLRSQTDTGPGKVRRRSTAMPTPLHGEIVMTYSQWYTLEAFIKNNLAGGSLPFLFPDQFGRATNLVRFADDLPTLTRKGAGRLSVQMQLEILP